MYFVSRVVGEVLPQVSLPLFGGAWSGFIVACSDRTVEDGLHHFIANIVERTFGRRL